MPGSPRRHPRPARLATVVMASLLLVGAVSCSKTSNGDNSSKDTSTNVGDGTSIVRTSSTTSTTAPASTTTLAKPVGRPEAKDSALTLYNAWKVNDRATASQVADASAIDSMFAAAPGDYELYRGCDTGEFDTGGCLFRNRANNDTIQIDVEKRNGQWVVANAFFSAG